jgi:hypothetical protein
MAEVYRHQPSPAMFLSKTVDFRIKNQIGEIKGILSISGTFHAAFFKKMLNFET